MKPNNERIGTFCEKCREVVCKCDDYKMHRFHYIDPKIDDINRQLWQKFGELFLKEKEENRQKELQQLKDEEKWI